MKESRHPAMETEFESISVGNSVSIEGVTLAKNGSEISVQISVVVTDFEGRKVYIASCRDLTEQRALEQERLLYHNY